LKSKENLTKRTLYTDTNLVKLPIFTTSKNTKKTKSSISLTIDSHKTSLEIKYTNGVPSWFDRRVLLSIEYLFYKRYPHQNEIRKKAETEIKNQTLRFQKESKKKTLSPIEKQHIIFRAMRNMREHYDLYITSRQISELIYTKTRASSAIKRSLEVLSQTKLLQKTTYRLAKEDTELDISELPLIEYSVSKIGNKDQYIINLNPLHFYNLLKRSYIGVDIFFLNSFDSPIAGRTAEFLKPLLHGQRKYGYTTKTIPYEDLCNYLHLSPFTSISRIKQQLSAFEELIEKNVIVGWKLEKALFGYEIDFYHDVEFFHEYYSALPIEEKTKIERTVTNIATNNPEKMRNIRNRALEFIQNTGVSEDEPRFNSLVEYYIRYALINEDI
jgi:hypothetical protein